MRSDKPVSRRVLVVDDSLETIHSLAFVLRDMGHEVEFAINGCAALEAARRFQPEVVLVDIRLPDTDGWEVTRRLKGEAGARPVRVIAITGRTLEGDRLRSLQAGCEEHLLKPLDWRQLERLLV
jgi:two-component system CheB/CheR fusion protein